MRDKKVISNFQIFTIIFTVIIGTLLHFTYEWSNNNLIVGAVSAVNESTWEHLKLLFFPMLFTTVIGYFYLGKSGPKYLCAKALGSVTAIVFIITFFYTYTGIIGTNFAILDILSFFIAILLGEYVTNKFLFSKILCNKKIAITFWGVLLLCFIIFTYITPHIGLFKDPITNQYGISNSSLVLL